MMSNPEELRQKIEKLTELRKRVAKEDADLNVVAVELEELARLVTEVAAINMEALDDFGRRLYDLSQKLNFNLEKQRKQLLLETNIVRKLSDYLDRYG